MAGLGQEPRVLVPRLVLLFPQSICFLSWATMQMTLSGKVKDALEKVHIGEVKRIQGCFI